MNKGDRGRFFVSPEFTVQTHLKFEMFARIFAQNLSAAASIVTGVDCKDAKTQLSQILLFHVNMDLGEGNADPRLIKAEFDLFSDLPFGRQKIRRIYIAEQSDVDGTVSEAVHKNCDIAVLQDILAVPGGLFHDFLGQTNIGVITDPDDCVQTPDGILCAVCHCAV